MKREPVATTIPGRDPVELVAYYEEFRDYYPYCELETKHWFVEHVRADWWMFDIGANVGYYTILFSQLAPEGRVFAFEPTATAEMLRSNLRHNGVGNAEVHEIALAATTGEREDRIFRLWGTEGEVKTYPFYALDDFIARQGIERVDCLKIDVDSFDFEVLRGAERTLAQRNPVVVVELNHALGLRNQGVSEALEWLARRGYRKALVLDKDNFVLQRELGGRSSVTSGSGDAASLELVFPPPLRFDEALSPSAGEPLGDSFIAEVELEQGAVVAWPEKPRNLISRARSLLRRDSSLAFRDVVDVPIETAAAAWQYALVLGLDPGAAPGVVTIEVGVEVMDGKLGIALAGAEADRSRFCAPERTLAAMPSRQRIVVSAKAADLRFLIFRNAALDGVRTRFKVLSIAARRRS
jgi:FkbM family methyltransferase